MQLQLKRKKSRYDAQKQSDEKSSDLLHFSVVHGLGVEGVGPGPGVDGVMVRVLVTTECLG